MGTLFQNRNFALLFSGQLVSVFGNNIFTLALPWFIYSVTGSKADLAIVGFAQSLPQLAGLVSGVYVDRWRKKQTMIWSDIARTAISLAVFIFAAMHASFWFIAVMVFLLQFLGTFFDPASSTLLPMIVEETQVPQAMGVSQSSNAAVQLLGQFGGGTLLGLFGAPLLFLINAITFFVSVLSLTWLRAPEPKLKGETQSFAQQWLSGVRTITKSRLLLLIIVSAIVVNFSLAPFDMTLTAWVKGPLHGNAYWLGAIGGAFFVGVMIGGMTIGIITKRMKLKQIVMTGLILSGLLIGIIGIVDNRYFDICVIFLAGLVNGILNGSLGSMLIQTIPNELRGRIIATVNALAKLAMPLGIAVFGALMVYVPLMLIFILMGTMAVVSGLSFLVPVEDELKALNSLTGDQPSIETSAN